MLEEIKHRLGLLNTTIAELIEIVECGDSIRLHMEATQFKAQVSRLNREMQSVAASSESHLLQTSARFSKELHTRAQRCFATTTTEIEPDQFSRLTEELLSIKKLLGALDFAIDFGAEAFIKANTLKGAPF